MQTSAPHRWQLAHEPRFVLFWWLMVDRFHSVVWSQS